MRMSLSVRLMLYIAVIALGLLVISLFIIRPAVNRILNMKRDIRIIQEELEGRYERTQKLKRSLQELQTIKQEVDKFAQATIQPGEELRVITELENLAELHGIEQTLNLSFKDAAQDKSAKGGSDKTHPLPQYYQFSFLNNGLFENQIRYLRSLEQLPYYLIIDNLQMEKRGGDRDDKNPVTLRFDARLYVDPS